VVIARKRVPGFCCQVTEGIDTIRRGIGYLFSVLKDCMVLDDRKKTKTNLLFSTFPSG